ncbi:outer membrane lipoprotein-sorting protein [Haliscomenobacter sp.]|uniref:outer membrane lipoprotein-sorting protein n=1 Tax=Haliscomenobacter sp. TaxID=2717303 RepID=UPI00336513EC
MKLKFLGLLLATIAFTNVYAQKTVDEIVALHVTALGGADKLKTVNTVVSERTIAVQGMEIPSKSVIVIGKSMRSESSIMGTSMVQVLNGDKGWKIMPSMMGGTGEPEDMSADEIKPLLGQLDPFGALYNYQEKGNKVELVGTEKVDKKDMIHLKITSKDGVILDEYLDAKTYLPYKVVTNVNGQEGELVFSDYEEVNGIKIANTIDITSQMGAITMITNKTVINGEIDQQVFVKPAK